MCPAQDHFIFLTLLIISMTFVLSLTQMLVFLSLYVMLSILLTILVCAAASVFCACLVSVQVSAPYVIAGGAQLHTCLFRQMARLLLKIFQCLAYATQPDTILNCISLPWFFSLRLLSCPKYTYVAFNFFYQHIVHVDWGVAYNHHFCICDFHLKTHSPTFIG